jgi:hypothetical protein
MYDLGVGLGLLVLGRGHVGPRGVPCADEVGGADGGEGIGLAALGQRETDTVAGGLREKRGREGRRKMRREEGRKRGGEEERRRGGRDDEGRFLVYMLRY